MFSINKTEKVLLEKEQKGSFKLTEHVIKLQENLCSNIDIKANIIVMEYLFHFLKIFFKEINSSIKMKLVAYPKYLYLYKSFLILYS